MPPLILVNLYHQSLVPPEALEHFQKDVLALFPSDMMSPQHNKTWSPNPLFFAFLYGSSALSQPRTASTSPSHLGPAAAPFPLTTQPGLPSSLEQERPVANIPTLLKRPPKQRRLRPAQMPPGALLRENEDHGALPRVPRPATERHPEGGGLALHTREDGGRETSARGSPNCRRLSVTGQSYLSFFFFF